MDYIEAKLSNKLDSLQNLISKNMRSFKQAEKSFELAESQVFLLGGEKNGKGGITQDIRAFFNIIKAQQVDTSTSENEQEGYPRKLQPDIPRKSPSFAARSKTPVRITKTPNRKPEVPRRSVTPSKPVPKSPLPENRKQQPAPPATKPVNRTPISKPPKEEERPLQKTPKDKAAAQGKENNRISKDLTEAVQALQQGGEPAAPKKRWEQLYELANREKGSTCASIALNQADSEPQRNSGRDSRGHKLSDVYEESEDETPRHRGFPHMTRTEKNKDFDSQESHLLEDFDLSSH